MTVKLKYAYARIDIPEFNIVQGKLYVCLGIIGMYENIVLAVNGLVKVLEYSDNYFTLED